MKCIYKTEKGALCGVWLPVLLIEVDQACIDELELMITMALN